MRRSLVAALCCAALALAAGDIVTDQLDYDPRSIVLVARPFGFQNGGGAGARSPLSPRVTPAAQF